MKTNLIAILILAFVLVACSGADTGTNVDADTEDTAPMEDATGMVVGEPDVIFIMTGENFAFFMNGEENPTLTVQEGQTVRIEFTSTQGFHDWVLDEFDAATTRVMETDGVTSVTFVADAAGTYEYYCSVGSHRANGMFGTLVVE